jgi:7-cyano-7-deazaguanine synthase
MKKAVVLLSGGLDSTTTLYFAKRSGYACFALAFDYGQRHRRELRSAAAVAKRAKTPFMVLKITLPWRGSSLLDRKLAIPARIKLNGIPSTYVPARNTIFLSFALSYAEAIGAKAVFIGANAVDFSGYPDCRPDYFRSFSQVARKGTKAGDIRIMTPLLKMSKGQIIRSGRKLGVPFELTWSCYRGGVKPCGTCDSCRLREKGFREAK